MSVVVPWVPEDGRTDAWAWLRARWEALYPAWELIEVPAPPVRFNAAQAVNDGVARSTGDVIVVAYADTLVDDRWVLQAVGEVGTGGAAVVAPEVVGYLGRFESADVLKSAPDNAVAIPVDGPLVEYRSTGWPGAAVASRDHLTEFPFDEAFRGAAYEGDAWLLASGLLGGRVARYGHTLHLWHPTTPERTWGAREAEGNRELYDRYVKADADGMRILVKRSTRQ